MPPPAMGDPSRDPDACRPEQIKIWETVNDEYVYWEDICSTRCSQFADASGSPSAICSTEKQLLSEFADSEQLADASKAKNKLDEVLKWTEEAPPRTPSAAAEP